MSDCEETLQELYRFLDGELAGEDRHDVQSHLDGCLDCLQAFDFHAELRIVIARKCADDPIPPSLLAKLADCFGQEGIEGFGAPGAGPDGDVGRSAADR